MIYKRRSTRAARPAHLHGYCRPDCDEEDTVCVPEQMPPSDTPDLAAAFHRERASYTGPPWPWGRAQRFSLLQKTQKHGNLKGGGAIEGWKPNIKGKVVHGFLFPKNFVEVKNYQETRSKHIIHHKT